MPDIDDFYPPQVYDWWWWAVLPVFLALLIGWILLSKWLAKQSLKSSAEDDVPVPAPFARDPSAAEKALARIAAVQAKVDAREETVRDAHIELSSIVREYAYRRTGVDARNMTLDELQASDLRPLADTVASYYPIAFAPDETEGVDDAVQAARGVVAVWS